MSSAEIANLLLELIAVVAVLSTLGGIGCVMWVTRARKNLPDHTPPVTIFKPLKGLDEELEIEPSNVLPARLSVLSAFVLCGR